MGGTKHSRKGVKAWRKNIDAREVEEFLEQDTHQQRRGPAVETLKDEELFFEDKAADDAVAAAKAPRRRREPKPLRSQLILESIKAVEPAPQQPQRKAKGPLKARSSGGSAQPAGVQAAAAQEGGAAAATEAAAAVAAVAPKAARGKRKRKGVAPEADIWDAAAAATAAATKLSSKLSDWAAPIAATELVRIERLTAAAAAGAAAGAAAAAAAPGSHAAKRRCGGGSGGAFGRPAGSAGVVPAVEVDLPGCSYNPEPELHQDALAVVVAAELKKQLKRELAPSAPPLHAPDGGGAPVDELQQLLGDAGGDSGSEDEGAVAGGAGVAMPAPLVVGDENEIALDEEGGDGGQGAGAAAPGAAAAAAASGLAVVVVSKPGEKKTRKERSRLERARQQRAEEAARAALKRQRRELQALPQLQEQIDEEAAARELRRQRRQVVTQEKAAIQPPRLGKAKYEAAAPPVLTSDEVTGSLRQLPPSFMVVADRFNSLQKRGLIEPRRPAGQRRRGRRVEFVGGDRTEKAQEGQAEVAALRQQRLKLEKAAAAGVGSGKAKGKAKGNAGTGGVLPAAFPW